MADDKLDDIFEDLDDYTPLELETEQAENTGDMGSVRPPPRIFDSLPQPLGDNLPVEFSSMISKVHAMYRMFPEIDQEAMYEELLNLSVKTISTPTLQLVNQELQKVQAVKERLAEIMISLVRVHTFKKRQVDILKESWIHFSTEKSADKRKADSVYRLSEFESDFLAIDALWKTANHILQNLSSTQEILSRRITIFNIEAKVYENGRHGIPDYEFRGASLNDEIGSPIEIDDSDNQSDGPLEADELEF